MNVSDSLSWGEPLLEAALILTTALVLWGFTRYLISGAVRRIQNGYSVLKRPRFKWAAPIFRNFDPARRIQRADTVGGLLRSGLGIVIWTVAIIMVLDVFGIPIAPLLASVGIAGVAIGFGAQQLVRDFIAGIAITIEDQFGVGDIIETAEVVGRVDALGLRITRVIDEEGTIWYLRNGEILRVGNRSQGDYRPKQSDEESQPASDEHAAE
jgi:small-conductance mechanosensitive channel